MQRHIPAPDPDMAELVALRRTQQQPGTMREIGLEALRARLEAMPPPATLPKMVAVEDHEIGCAHGRLPVRVYSPSAEPELPAIVYFHAGGLVMGSNHSFEPLARSIAEYTGHRVFAVDYHLAPEHPPPGQIDDAWAATQWVTDHAAELGVLPSAVSVFGDSAGGTLAALVALRARDLGGPRLMCQVLLYGGLDQDMAAPSVMEHADGFGLTRDDLFYLHEVARAGATAPLGGDEVPAYAPDLRGVAPAIVVVGELDPARDWSERYAARLRDAGVQTTLTRYPGVGHGFVMQLNHLARGRQALAEIAGMLRAKIERPLPW